MTIANIHRLDWTNIGDISSSPCNYFDLGHCVQAEVMACAWPEFDYYIIGGGGLIHGEPWPDAFHSIIESDAKVIFWGIGSNEHYQTEPTWHEWMNGALLTGIRDWGSPFQYVPCPSCMHPAFDLCRCVVPRYKYVIYEHHGAAIPISQTFRLNNNQPMEAFLDVISFLAHGEIIISNSFHGLYWAMLLNRKAVCVMPMSSRFYGFKYPPVYADVNNYKEAAETATTHPDYLAECRKANIDFYEQVKGIINHETNRPTVPTQAGADCSTRDYQAQSLGMAQHTVPNQHCPSCAEPTTHAANVGCG